ncbi:Uncharacterised protein [Vibrio cholerae]|nr:Uncharacterised protein [Vibrio cholerae]
MNIDKGFVLRDARQITQGLNNADIGLMRDHHIDFFGR